MANTQKKVLQLSTTPIQHDGLTGVIFSLMENAPRENVKIDLALGMGGSDYFLSKLDHMGIKVIFLPHRKRVIKYFINLILLLKKEHYDVLHVHGNSATMAIEMLGAYICGVKIRIAHCHNTKTNHPIVHKILKRALIKLINTPVACGKAAGEFLFGDYFTVIPNCIAVNQFQYNEEKRRKIRGELKILNENLIGHVGRFSYQKNHEMLLDIFKKVLEYEKNAKLLLIGEGELENEIRLKAEKLKISKSIIFYGTCGNVNELMQAMDIFVLPSRYEGLSITAIEAQAAGLQLILGQEISAETDQSGLCTFIPRGSDANIWAKKIVDKLSKKYDRSIGAKKIIESGYDISALTDKIKYIWQLD